MTGENVDWLPALAVLVLGAAVGLFLAWTSARRRASRPGAGPAPETRDLQGELESLIAQLRELDDQASKRTAEQIAAERGELELRAARVLRDLERDIVTAAPVSTEPEPESDTSAPVAASGGGLRGFLWGAGSVAALALLLFLVTRGASDREAGGSPTGGSLAPQAQQQPPSSAPMVNIAELRRAVEARPNDPQARMNLAQALLFSQDLRGVQEQTDLVLGQNPDHPRALSYGAIVQLAMGNVDEALRMAARSVQLDPNDPEARVHLALIHAQRGEQADAERVLEEAIRSFPSDATALQAILADFRRAGGAAAPAPAAAAPAGGGVQIDVSLAGGGPGRGVVFVEARVAGQADSDPVAVRRESVGAFPATLSLSDADSMTGRLPEAMRIDVRLDADGNPATHGPGDRGGFAEGVVPGSRVAVTLQPRG